MLIVLLLICTVNSFIVTNDLPSIPSLNKPRIKVIKPSIDTLVNKDDLKDIITSYANKGLDVLIYGPPGVGKTHSMVTHSSEITNKIKNVKDNQPFRTLYLSHSRELAIQSAELTSSIMNRNNISLLIGNACKTDLISLKKRFVLSTSNALSEYLLLLDSIDRKAFIESIKLLVVDEVDALYKLPKKYNRKKTELWAKKKNSFYNILQAILAVNKNKTQIIAASATLNRQLIRSLDSLIHTFKDNDENNIIYIRVQGEDKQVNDNIELFHRVSKNFEDEMKYVSKIVTDDTLIFANHSYSLIRIKEALLNFGIESTLLHESMGIIDKRMQTMDKILDTCKTNKFQNNGIRIASMDSARGLVTMSKNIILLGKPRNCNEFIHLIGRVIHSGGGKCTILGDQNDIEYVESDIVL